jgi:hypothetical protein
MNETTNESSEATGQQTGNTVAPSNHTMNETTNESSEATGQQTGNTVAPSNHTMNETTNETSEATGQATVGSVQLSSGTANETTQETSEATGQASAGTIVQGTQNETGQETNVETVAGHTITETIGAVSQGTQQVGGGHAGQVASPAASQLAQTGGGSPFGETSLLVGLLLAVGLGLGIALVRPKDLLRRLIR